MPGPRAFQRFDREEGVVFDVMLKQFRNGAKIGIVETLVGTHGEAVGEPRGEITEAAMTARGGGLLFDQFLHLSWEDAKAATVGIGAVLTQCAEEFFQNMAAFELDLLELRRAKDEVEGDALVKCALDFDVGSNAEVAGVTVGAVTEEAAAWCEGAAVHKAPDACAKVRFVAVFADDLAELVDQRDLCGVEGLACGPFGNGTDVDIASVNAVDDVVERVGGIISPVHDLTFDAFKGVECLRGT